VNDDRAPRGVPVATAVLAHPDGQIVHVNRRWSDLLAALGRTPADFGGRPWEAWWFGDPHDRGALAYVVRSSDPCVLRSFTTEQRGRRTVWDGLLIPVPATDPPAILLACTDATDAALARERLAEQARLHEELLSHAGHELRGPLAPLATWSEVLRRMLEQPGRDAQWDGQAGRALASFDRHLRVLTLRLDDLFAITRLERDPARERQTLEIGALLELLAGALPDFPAAPPMRVEREPSARGRVVADAPWLARAVQGLAADVWARSPMRAEIVLRASSAGAAPRVARFEITAAGDLPASATPVERSRERHTPALALQLARLVAELHQGRTGVEDGEPPPRYWIEIPLVAE
jgi:signal transduction histidine kinase